MDADGRDGGPCRPSNRTMVRVVQRAAPVAAGLHHRREFTLVPWYDLFSRHLESTHYIVPIIFGPEDDHSVDYHDADMACDEDACDVEDDEPVFKTMATMCTMAGP